jgi:hypothetical protein
MERVPVESSNVVSIGYDTDASVMEVEYGSGGVYQYPDIAGTEHAGIMAADSVGSRLHSVVKKKPFLKLEPAKAS